MGTCVAVASLDDTEDGVEAAAVATRGQYFITFDTKDTLGSF